MNQIYIELYRSQKESWVKKTSCRMAYAIWCHVWTFAKHRRLCTHICIHIYIYACIYVYTSIYLYVYIHPHIYIFLCLSFFFQELHSSLSFHFLLCSDLPICSFLGTWWSPHKDESCPGRKVNRKTYLEKLSAGFSTFFFSCTLPTYPCLECPLPLPDRSLPNL